MINSADLQGVRDIVYLGDIRTPVYKVLLFDNTDTFSQIVLGTNVQVPRDITGCVIDCSINESEDAATTANLTIIPDPLETDELSPYHFVQGRVVQVLYYDGAIQNDSYISLFIGPIVGQPGYRRNRETNEKIITVSCLDRSFYYNNDRKLNSPEYVQDTDLGDVAVDVATDGNYGMGLEREECKFGLFRHEVAHTKVYLADIPFMEGLKYLGFIVDRAPVWDSDGCLIMKDVSLTKPPVRVYQDESLFLNIDWPQGKVDIKNQVKIIGIDSEMSKVIAPMQTLATVNGTVGYFEEQFKKQVYYTQDEQGRAQNVEITSYSINGQLSSILGGKPYLIEINEFSCVLVIDTPYQSWVFIIFFTTYITFFTISGFLGGLLQDIMFVAAAIWLTAGLMIMQQMGTFEVTISGEPYKLVYKEIEGEATWANLNDYEIRPMTIENHLVDSQTLADTLAYRELKREACKEHTRDLSLPFDPFLQSTDIIELPDATRYYLKSISKKFRRGEPANMDLSAMKVRDGNEYNGTAGFSEY